MRDEKNHSQMLSEVVEMENLRGKCNVSLKWKLHQN